MQRVQRTFGKALPRSADESQVAALLQDFARADEMLGRIIEASKQWRQAWAEIMNHQVFMMHEIDALYHPIPVPGDSMRQMVPTDPETLERAEKMKDECTHLKAEMMEEIMTIDTKLIRAATDAKDSIKPMKKVIRKREDRKLDYERYNSRVNSAQTKTSDRQQRALVKHETDLSRATLEYEAADDNIKQKLPAIVAATFSLLPYLLAQAISLQNTILGTYYTSLHHYCEEVGYTSPPPEFEDIVSLWDANFTPMRKEIEGSFQMLVHGKAVHQPMAAGEKGSTVTGLGIRNRITDRRASGQSAASPALRPAISPRASWSSQQGSTSPQPPAIGSKPRIPSSHKLPQFMEPAEEEAPPPRPPRPTASPKPIAMPSPGAYLERANTNSSAVSNGSGPAIDYFSKPRTPSGSTGYIGGSASSGVIATPLAGISPGQLTPGMNGLNITKKKPPPPPPKKKSFQDLSEYVVALYDFEGLNPEDLRFKEGDKIKILKKTESTQDWWEGELRGTKGQFPANYCEAAR